MAMGLTVVKRWLSAVLQALLINLITEQNVDIPESLICDKLVSALSLFF